MRTKSVAKQVTVEQLLKVQELVRSKGEARKLVASLERLDELAAKVGGLVALRACLKFLAE
jgi:hypothetical protein